MDEGCYVEMLNAFNSVLEGFPEDTSDMVIEDVIGLKGLFMDLYGE